jgi:hypothetical protein
MLETHEVPRTSRYLRVRLPEVLPPDWDSLEDELDLEFDRRDGAPRLADLLGRHGVRPGPGAARPLREEME